MKSKFIKFIISCVISSLFSYFIVAFVLWQWNPSQMREEFRAAIVLEILIFTVINALVFLEEDKPKN